MAQAAAPLSFNWLYWGCRNPSVSEAQCISILIISIDLKISVFFPLHIPCCLKWCWDWGDHSLILVSATVPLCDLAYSPLTLDTLIQKNSLSSSCNTNLQSQPEAKQQQLWLEEKRSSKAPSDTSTCSPAYFAFLLLSLPWAPSPPCFISSTDVSAASKWQFLPLLSCCQFPGIHSPSKRRTGAAWLQFSRVLPPLYMF